MKRILVTAIGSMSAQCVITNLKSLGYEVYGCDIYEDSWHFETSLCDYFFQAPLATDKQNYIIFLKKTIIENNIDILVPLTDLEIDVINDNLSFFSELSIKILIQTPSVLKIVRNKYLLYKEFMDDKKVPTISTILSGAHNDMEELKLPCVAKPINGRSSEGLAYIETVEDLDLFKNKKNYLIQEKKTGFVYTVDYIRDDENDIDYLVPRKELLRTKNGAGITVEIKNNKKINELVSYIGKKLKINGCINLEFIENEGNYYLIDINPRFSAGIAFSCLAGYNFIKNTFLLLENKLIETEAIISEGIYTKHFIENKSLLH